MILRDTRQVFICSRTNEKNFICFISSIVSLANNKKLPIWREQDKIDFCTTLITSATWFYTMSKITPKGKIQSFQHATAGTQTNFFSSPENQYSLTPNIPLAKKETRLFLWNQWNPLTQTVMKPGNHQSSRVPGVSIADKSRYLSR